MIEEWRPTHHSHYEVSNWGRVRSFRLLGRFSARGRSTTPCILKGNPDVRGYPGVCMWEGGKRKRHPIHRLVAAAFLGPCPLGQEVLHNDDDPTNAALSNLEYGTHTKNCRDAVRRDRCPSATLTVDQVRYIRHLYAEAGLTQVQLSEVFGVGQGQISSIVRRETWAHV